MQTRLAERDTEAAASESLIARNEQLEAKVRELSSEKALIDEQQRQLFDEQSRRKNELREVANQRAAVCAERDELRHQNERLLAEIRSAGAERSAINEERNVLSLKRKGYQQNIEELKARIAQLGDENSVLAVAKATASQQCELADRQNEHLHSHVAELGNEIGRLTATNAGLRDEQRELRNEIKRLVDCESELQALVAGRETTSEELNRALLQVNELQKRQEQNKTLASVYTSSKSKLGLYAGH